MKGFQNVGIRWSALINLPIPSRLVFQCWFPRTTVYISTKFNRFRTFFINPCEVSGPNRQILDSSGMDSFPEYSSFVRGRTSPEGNHAHLYSFRSLAHRLTCLGKERELSFQVVPYSSRTRASSLLHYQERCLLGNS